VLCQLQQQQGRAGASACGRWRHAAACCHPSKRIANERATDHGPRTGPRAPKEEGAWPGAASAGQEDAAADEAVVLEEELSDEEADSAGPVKWVVPQWEVLAADRGGWRAGLIEGTASERK
jgi:hypothetical protein